MLPRDLQRNAKRHSAREFQEIFKSLGRRTMIIRPTGGDAVYEPPRRMKGALVQNMEEYNRLYKQSLENPEAFWSEVSERFHWETKWHTLHKTNFDTSKGPVKIEW
jgi:hypothetical protein